MFKILRVLDPVYMTTLPRNGTSSIMDEEGNIMEIVVDVLSDIHIKNPWQCICKLMVVVVFNYVKCMTVFIYGLYNNAACSS